MPSAQGSWESSVASFLEYCAQPKADNEAIKRYVGAHISNAEAEAITHIRPDVFLIDSHSALTLDEQRTSVAAPKLLADSNEDGEEVAAVGRMKLRSGTFLIQHNSARDTDVANPEKNESHDENLDEVDIDRDDAEYQDDGRNGSDDDDAFMIDVEEVRELQGVDTDSDNDSKDQNDESSTENRQFPEHYISVEGFPLPIPIWEYLGPEFTHDIVSHPGRTLLAK